MGKERIILRNSRVEQEEQDLLREMARRIRELERAVFGAHKGRFSCERTEDEEGVKPSC